MLVQFCVYRFQSGYKNKSGIFLNDTGIQRVTRRAFKRQTRSGGQFGDTVDELVTGRGCRKRRACDCAPGEGWEGNGIGVFGASEGGLGMRGE